MNRTEFIDKMRAALTGNVNHNKIEENIRFYHDYIDMEVKKGRDEQDVVLGMGDPRLIAKTIIEANKAAGDGSAEENTIYDEYENTERQNRNHKSQFSGLSKVFTVLAVIAGIFLVISLFTTVISFLSPILIPVILFYLIYRMIQRIQG